ncbi:hypothetical protein TUM3794_11150 [Shewanella colwelliana]|uniref:DUF2846 domain-containing protein n=1 Tax=Shewanella colwelliana TaxID=23 RepID=A0ABQ4NWU8_SHECO|nr:DUF2846 domain-containing protein [Shewanella colwelliana]GIU38547.1 hypothetical protein TUM3794_11150 [Shewanella colwelliana]
MNFENIKLNAGRLIVLATVLLSTACSTTYKVDPELVAKFKPEAVPTQEQTFVYVIRGSNFQGGARGAWVAANENVVADLSNGSHTLLKLASGLNSIHLVQGLAGFGYAKVDNKPGETLFYSIDYTTGKMTELTSDMGASMIMQTKKAKDIGEPRKNDAYDNLLANPSLLGFKVMKPSAEPMIADAETAVISFYRMETLIGEVPFDIWSEAGYVGSTKAGDYFQVRVAPGKHTFVALSERYSVLEAEVEAGKEYVVEFDVDMGWNQAHVQILPIDPVKSAKTIKKWQAKAKLMALDDSVVSLPEFQQRVEMAREYLLPKFKSIDAGDMSTRALTTQHAL